MKIKCPECQTSLQRDGRVFRCATCSFQVEIEDDLIGEAKKRLNALKQSLKGLSLEQLKRAVEDKDHPVTTMLIGFAAWGITYFARWPIFMAVLVGLSILLGPWGLILMVVLPLVYRAHREAIENEAKRMANEKGGSPAP